MIISGNVPEHLLVGARTGFLSAVRADNLAWQRVAGQLVINAKATDLVDIGGAPMPLSDRDGLKLQSYIEKHVEVKPLDWQIVVGLSHNAINDDQTGQLESKVRGAGENFNRHMNKLVFQALNAGDGTTYGTCYDGKAFFANDHADSGADYSTAQDNNFALALSLDNFTTVLNAAHLFMDDRGEYTDHSYDLIVVPPALEYVAAQITGNAQAYDTGNREANPYASRFQYIVSPYMDATGWALLASSQVQKPLYLAMREQPNLQSAWFDPAGPDGGMYYFKFYSRYNVFYGDWRLAALGNT